MCCFVFRKGHEAKIVPFPLNRSLVPLHRKETPLAWVLNSAQFLWYRYGGNHGGITAVITLWIVSSSVLHQLERWLICQWPMKNSALSTSSSPTICCHFCFRLTGEADTSVVDSAWVKKLGFISGTSAKLRLFVEITFILLEKFSLGKNLTTKVNTEGFLHSLLSA